MTTSSERSPVRSHASRFFNRDALLFGLAYLTVAAIGHALSFQSDPFPLVWVPSGLLVAFLTRRPLRTWPSYLVAALFANLVSARLLHHQTIGLGLVAWISTAVEAVAGAALLRRLFGANLTCSRPREVLGLVLLAALLSTMLGAVIGAAALVAMDAVPEFWPAWRVWWASHALGVLIVAPLLLTHVPRRVVPDRRLAVRTLEFVLALTILLGIAGLNFRTSKPPLMPIWQFPYLLAFLFLVGIGARFHPQAVSIAITLFSLLVVWQTTHGRGPFAWATDNIEDRALLLKVFLATTVLTPLLLASAFAERRCAEQVALEGKRRFRAIFDQTFQFIGLLTPDGTLLEANQTALDFIGCTREDVVGKPFWETPWWTGQPALQDRLKQAITRAAMGEIGRFEAEHLGADGSIITVDFSVKPCTDERGRVVLLIPEGRDITDHVRAEQLVRTNDALIASEQRLRQLADAMPQMAWMARSDGYLDYYNERWYEFTGLPRNGGGDESWKPILHPDDLTRCLDLWYKSVRTGEPYRIEYRFLDRKTGQYRWHLGLAMPMKDDTGQIIRWFGTCTDIDDQKRTEEQLRLLNESYERRVEERTAELAAALAQQEEAVQALRLSEERFRGAFNASAIGMALVDPHGRWLKVNASLCRIVGYTEQELRKISFQDITHPDDLDADLRLVNRLLDGEISAYHLEKRYLSKQGRIVWVVLSVSLVRDACGQPVHFVAQIVDVTARKQQEQELRQARDTAMAATRAKAEFLANMSHEIRTPMNGVLGMAELALGTDLNPRQKEYVEAIKASAEALLTVINDILDFSKVEAGKLALDQIPFDVQTVLDQSLKPLAMRAEAKNLHLHAQVASDVPAILIGDPNRFRQILTNLVGNAIKFTEVGEISVSIDRADGSKADDTPVLVTVADTGIGVPKDRRDAIFEPFVQADGSTTRLYGGSGLGLAISAHLVELMGGRLWVEDNTPHGSRFRFTARLRPATRQESEPGRSGQSRMIPTPPRIAAPLPEQGPRREETDMATPSEPLRVLLAEDNPTNQLVARHMLERLGHTATVVGDGQAALDALDTETFDLVLMDVQMPRMDGFQALATLRNREKSTGKHIPVVALTAHAMVGDRERCLNAGFDGYLAKPIRLQELRSALTDLSSQNLETEPPAQHFQPAELEKSLGEDASLILEIVDRFTTDFETDLIELETAFHADDGPRLARQAHKTRGACLLLGASKMAATLQALEQTSAHGDLACALEQLDHVKQQWPPLAQNLQSYTHHLRATLAPAS